jgi:hypothetical protein
MEYLKAFDARPIVAAVDADKYNMASWQYEKLAEQITEFQNALDDSQEIGLMFASFGQPIMMLVESIGYQNPNLLYFYGYVNGREAQLIQHMNQLNFLLTVQKVEAGRKPRRIGFDRSDPPTSSGDKE